jgi:penicillin-binding protein 2
VKKGDSFEARSENNRLKHTVIFADRGIIYDRNKKELAWNELNPQSDFSFRKYASSTGLSHVVGYVKYPSKDKSGFYYEESFIPKDGVELTYNDEILGKNGLKITETDALGHIQSESVIAPPEDGKNLILSIDARVEQKLYESIKSIALDRGFSGGAGVIMDVHNGEILALASYPEYSPSLMTDGSDTQKIKETLSDKAKPFLNRAIGGLYIPGSIMKPYVAMGALSENIIDPMKQILSTGSLAIPNPYNPSNPTVSKDWKAHGWVDMRHALAVSSNVYFFTVGGGFGDQRGIGISNIQKYVQKFGFGKPTGIDLLGEVSGTVPSPEWKAKNFPNDPWRIGDTYNSSIGQYGFQVTPVQAVRAVAAMANGGTLLTPTILLDNPKAVKKIETVGLDPKNFQIVREGMRLSVTQGIAGGLLVPGMNIAAKTGTAELGVTKETVNSWVTGFFPYENPRFAFAVLMEKGSRSNIVGATFVMRSLLDWMTINTPEYTK